MIKKILFIIVVCGHTIKIDSHAFWHLQDSTIGMHYVIKPDQRLSWNFSLWDLAPKKGCSSRIVIIDGAGSKKKLNQKLFVPSKEILSCGEKLFSCGQSVDKSRERWLSDNKKKTYLDYFLKNVQQFHDVCTKGVILQIAPEASITTCTIFDDFGYSSMQKLYATLQEVPHNNFDIFHLGCKITHVTISEKDQNKFHTIFKNMKFIVASSGNDSYEKNMAYPARCPDVAFDIGAFNSRHEICSFSQFESFYGPKIVLPGQDILCPVFLNNQSIGDVSLSGTSISAALMTGFLALVTAEFGNDFSYRQIVTVIYKSAYKLIHNNDWKEKVLLGAVDMRTALFSLHVLKEIKNMLSKKKFEKNYDTLIDQIFIINQLYENQDSTFVFDFLYIVTTQILQNDQALQKLIRVVADLTIATINNYPHRKLLFKKLFDNRLLCLLRTKKKQHLELHDNVLYALNRKP